ncbi:DeoR-family transcriptional regulator [Streptomyces venezuelae]|uniref:DeoR/GlpR family DNA-binding transcription regulator n=1 Tax=Streptomyces gardneri TaxID=66892 RepID=UPI0006BD4894|nr:DeoR/GlpR family DNA-binding transcription regulator [Streptomyces gardneri]ALO13182.1 DeoR-family transcriptional regulator [Streptomyces venezuelae]QPK49846.1 DeoR/GlpR transcriptional regulator [Streptomyces gardneri]WRK41412.1 DeoR/GlpR family DNA-binding transcription regulator [Streptomyces venezuelae]CUM36139.1 Glycerol-3-phosphate regulon repressor [Streptomyces venezuelae]
MSKHERWNALLEMLATSGKVEVEEAATALEVSAATIRRDLDELAEQQLLVRTRGGAVAHGVSYELPLRYKSARHASEKQRIAAAVAELVAPGEVVGLNGGTTTTEVARALALRFASGRAESPGAATAGPELTVVTNALNIAGELAVRPQIKIVTTGGVARPQTYELVGPLTVGVLSEVVLDVVILGVDGVDPELGVMAHHEDEANISRLFAQRSSRVVVVTDSSKMGRRAFARICGLDRIDLLVTDTDISAEATAQLTEAGVKVLTV